MMLPSYVHTTPTDDEKEYCRHGVSQDAGSLRLHLHVIRFEESNEDWLAA